LWWLGGVALIGAGAALATKTLSSVHQAIDTQYDAVKSKLSTEVKPIENAGNTCFAAAFVQLFMRTSAALNLPTTTDTSRKSTPVLDIIRDVVEEYQSESTVNKVTMHNLCKAVALNDGRQHDVDELMTKVFNSLHAEIAEKLSSDKVDCKTFNTGNCAEAELCATVNDGVSILSVAFAFMSGQLRGCITPPYTKWEFARDWLLRKTKSTSTSQTLQKILDLQFALGSTNGFQWTDSSKVRQTCSPANSREQSLVFTAPPFLWFSLQRSQHAGAPSKLTYDVQLEETVRVSVAAQTSSTVITQASTHTYKLIGFCVHYGTGPTSGHWVAYTMVGSTWYLFNDNKTPKAQAPNFWNTDDIRKNVSMVLLEKEDVSV
jgi:ubiquitin C-terminal hydrolase